MNRTSPAILLLSRTGTHQTTWPNILRFSAAYYLNLTIWRTSGGCVMVELLNCGTALQFCWPTFTWLVRRIITIYNMLLPTLLILAASHHPTLTNEAVIEKNHPIFRRHYPSSYLDKTMNTCYLSTKARPAYLWRVSSYDDLMNDVYQTSLQSEA